MRTLILFTTSNILLYRKFIRIKTDVQREGNNKTALILGLKGFM